jgi:hypothetical protein
MNQQLQPSASSPPHEPLSVVVDELTHTHIRPVCRDTTCPCGEVLPAWLRAFRRIWMVYWLCCLYARIWGEKGQ